jgi:sterol carrier protein 2
MSGQRKVYVVGVGMTKFEKPGSRKWQYPDMLKESVTKALEDAGLKYSDIQQAAVGYVYGDSTCGQRGLYSVGLTGIPIYNVNNNCSTGSTALYLAKQLVGGSVCECALACGFEQMKPGSLESAFNDRTNPMDNHFKVMIEQRGFGKGPGAAQLFGNAGKEHMDRYGSTAKHYAKIGHKNHKHSKNNPYAQFQDEYTLEEVESARPIFPPLTLLQCSPTSDGSGAAILCSEAFVKKHNLQHQAVEIIGQSMVTDFENTFTDKSCISMVGFDMTKTAAEDVYKQAGVTPKDIQVIELHDCFSANELITYEALGLCPKGKAGDLIDAGDNTYGGKWVINPSGGLISKGHPLGATGLAQCAELCWQVRQMATNRQVPNCKVGLQHNIGLGGAVVVTMYRLGFPNEFKPLKEGQSNPAVTLTNGPVLSRVARL